MKSIAVMAKDLNISSPIIREYLSRFDQLSERLGRLITTIENLNDGLYFVNENRVITYWNKAAERITGFPAGEVMGRPCFQNILTHVDGQGRSLCTGLANRNYIERELEIRFEEKKRIKLSFGILFMDIDHFKAFNDQYGHDAGDDVLKFVSRTFMSNARPFDLYGRWGGEEFVGIVRNVGVKDLERMGNRVRVLIESSYLFRGEKKYQVTISIGVAVAGDDDTMESIIKRADTLMYQSKASGRNRLTAE